MSDDRDGAHLLSSDGVADLLTAFVDYLGGELVSWSMEHIDAHPGYSTTATYACVVDWSYGRREEIVGVTARQGGPSEADGKATIFHDGQRRLALWLYPDDPDLPGLTRVAFPDTAAEILNSHQLTRVPVVPADLDLDVVTYRPRRRAVVSIETAHPRSRFFVKVLRHNVFAGIVERHRLLLNAGVPAPQVAAVTPDDLLVLRELPGRALASAIFDEEEPCTAEQLVELLDSFPPAIARLPRRPAWSDAIAHYGAMVAASLPEARGRIERLVADVEAGLKGIPAGNDAVHGDFHEGQVHVASGRVVGILDVDTVGPGRRADDLACLVAHLSTIQHMSPSQARHVYRLLHRWVPVFDERVDPMELRLRTAAVVVSLATGPYRGQEASWEEETLKMIATAEALVRQVR